MTFLLPFLAWLMVLYSPATESPSEVNSVRLRTNIVITENAYKSNNPVIPIKHQELIDCLSWYESRNNPEAVGKAGEICCLIDCESGGNPNAWNKKDPNGGSKGILQFQEPTFYQYAKEVGIENPDIWSAEQQIETANYMLSKGLLHQWTCGEKCGTIDIR